MGKEPAGLRRWRLAHRKHKRKRKVYVMPRRRRAYRGRKRKGGKRSHSIPFVTTVIALYPAYESYKYAGFTKALPETLVQSYTGYHPVAKTFNINTPIYLGGALLLSATVGRKLANKVGLNRIVRKVSMGMLTAF